MTAADARALDDYCLEERLRDAVRDGQAADVVVLRQEARRRFAGMFGLPPAIMED